MDYAFLLTENSEVYEIIGLAANGWQLAEGGDFMHEPSYEALMFICPQNCPTKHETATFGKVLLADALLLSVVALSVVVKLQTLKILVCRGLCVCEVLFF